MEKILELINHIFNKTHLLSCFWAEIFCLGGIILNLFARLFLNKKRNIKKLSDVLTFSIFSINALFFLGIFVKNVYFSNAFNFAVLSNVFIFNNENLLLKFFINLFFALFVLCTYKITKKSRYSATLMNTYLLLLSIASGLLIQVENAIISFMLLDICAFFIYKYASNMRLRKYEMFSREFVSISILSSVLFYGFYSLLFLSNGQTQSSIVQLSAAVALLLKAGLFPIYNYTLAKNTKNNLPYSTLLFAFLPFLGVVSFLKFSTNAFFTTEIYCVTIGVFMLIAMFFASLSAFKSNNIVRYLANCAYTYYSLYILNALIVKNNEFAIYSSFVLLFSLFVAYCYLYILKMNFKTEKMNTSLLLGLSFDNKIFACLFSIGLLVLASCIPSIFSFNNIQIIKGIYEFDKYGSWVCIVYIFSNILILLNALKMIKNLYIKKDNHKEYVLTKRTTYNYVVPVIIVVVLVLGIFL